MRFFLFLAFLLAACSPTPTPTLVGTPLATAALATTATVSVANTPTAESVATETPIPAVPSLVYLHEGAAAFQNAVGDLSHQNNWHVQIASNPSLEEARVLVQANAQSVVVEGTSLAVLTLSLAREFPNVRFIGLDQSGTDLPPNVLLLGGEANRYDQAGFLAGMVAGFATQTRRVAVVASTNTVAGYAYRNGFIHGVLYSCVSCRADAIDLADDNAIEFARSETLKYSALGADVFYAAAGAAGEAALAVAAQDGAWVIGHRAGLEVGGEKLLANVYLDPALGLAAAIRDTRSGSEGFSLANGAVTITVISKATNVLSPLDLKDIETAQARLATRELETGIDPTTGAEK